MTSRNETIEHSVREACTHGEYARAATSLLEGYGREILGFLLSRLRNADLAGEVFSQFSEDLWRGLPGFEWRCSARVWAYTLARHAASRELKAARRDQVPLDHANELSALAQRLRTETLRMLTTAVKSRFAALRERLSEEDQTLLLLRVNRGLDWREIAQVLIERPPADDATLAREAARLRKRFQLAKQQLRELARAEGLIESEGDHID